MRLISALAALSLLATAALADQEVRHPFSQSVRRGSIRRVVVDIPAGEIDIRNGASDTVAVSGEVRRSYDGYSLRNRQQAMVDDISVRLTVNGDEAVVERRFGPNAGSWSARSWHTGFRVRLELPSGTDVDLGTRYGEVHLDGDFGNVDVDLRAGEIHLRMPRSAVRSLNASVRVGEVHADLGDERVNNEGIFPGSTHFYNAAGRAVVNLHTTAGEVHVTLMR